MINNRVIIFKMNEQLNDYRSIQDIQNNYFEKELKENGGKYFVPGKDSKNYSHSKDIKDDEIILFLYKNMFIASAKINRIDGKYYYKLEKDINKELKYYFCLKDIHKIPQISKENLMNFFEENLTSRTSIEQVHIKNEYLNKFENYINSGFKYSLSNQGVWNKLINKLRVTSLLNEINLYNYENIHTAFLSNFLKEYNIYKLGNEPLKNFINLLKEKSNKKINIDEIKKFEIESQKFYDDNGKKIIPDITITINNKYRIIIEAKVCAYENLYEDKIKQSEKYYSYFEKLRINSEMEYIYVFLTMRKNNEVKNFINITFKDIYEKLYKKYFETGKENIEILKEYLKSFHYFCNSEKFNFNIDEIPPVFLIDKESLIKNLDKIKEDINDIAEYKIPSNINKDDLLYYRYILVLLYNMDVMDNEIIKKCYNNL